MKKPVTLITGSSSGIGLATALRFADLGHQVYASIRSLDRAHDLKAAAAAKELSLQIVELDVTDAGAVQRVVGDVLAREGQIDVLVNNAGIAPLGSIETTSESTVHAIFDTNVFGPLRTIRAVLPSMRARRSGTIVNVSSVVGRVATAGGVYAASKFALEAVSETLAQEVYGFGIRVAIVEPSFTVTPILTKSLDSLTLDPSSPYATMERGLARLFEQARTIGGSPDAVAETIAHAVTTTEPKLRYPVGAGAEAFVKSRSQVSDEDWIALAASE